MKLDNSLINTLHYKVRNKGKVEEVSERSSTPLYLGVVVIEKGALRSPTLLLHVHPWGFQILQGVK